MAKMIVNSEETKAKAIHLINEEFREHKYLRLSIVTGEHRSLAMNALSWAWYQQISIERGEYTPKEVHAECKVRFGVPIMRRDCEEFQRQYDQHIKPLPWEPKLHFVGMLPITSEMTTAQMKEYLEEMKAHYANLPTDPVILEFPDELEDAAK